MEIATLSSKAMTGEGEERRADIKSALINKFNRDKLIS